MVGILVHRVGKRGFRLIQMTFLIYHPWPVIPPLRRGFLFGASKDEKDSGMDRMEWMLATSNWCNDHFTSVKNENE